MRLFRLVVQFHSDWHVGVGSGREGIDRQISRDHEGLPFIPAKSLTGVLRDSCEEVVNSLGLDTHEDGVNWVTFLFGNTASPANISVRPARVDQVTREWLSSLPPTARSAIAQNLATTKPGVSIDRRSGRAKDDHLSFTEIARPMMLEAQVILHDDDSPGAVALLAASCALTEYIGGKRRRGLGRCSMRLLTEEGQPVDVDFTAALPRDEFVPSLTKTPSGGRPAGGGGEVRLMSLTITANTPLLFPRERNGNVVSSFDYVPGSALLPLVHEVLTSVGIDAAGAIRAGHVKVTSGVPVLDDRVARPTPFAYSVEKDNFGSARASSVVNTLRGAGDGTVVTKQLRSGWVIEDTSKEDASKFVGQHTVTMTAKAHNSVLDSLQRPTEETGGLFIYEAIGAGQVFRADIVVSSDIAKILDENEKKLPATASLGSSRKDDYGSVSLLWSSPRDIDEEESKTDGGTLALWCVAPLLVEEIPGVGLADSVAAAIAQELRIALSECAVDVERSRIRPVRLDSWQSRWMLPRPSMTGLAAGSCLTITIPTRVDTSRISRLSTFGVGRRTTEGFGRVIVNSPLLAEETYPLTQLSASDEKKKELKALPTTPNEGPVGMAVVAAVRSALKDVVTELFWGSKAPKIPWTSPGASNEEGGSNHQFAILRMWVSTIEKPLDNGDKERFDHDLEAWGNRASSAAWNLLSDRNEAWSLVGEFPHPFGDGRSSLPESVAILMWPELVRMLVNEAHRKRTRGVGNGAHN